VAYITPTRLDQVVSLPFNMAETELRRGKTMVVWSHVLEYGQRLEARCINLHINRILSPGVTPERANSSLGLCSCGLYFGPMLTSSGALVISSESGVANQSVTAFNGFSKRVFITPGTYKIIVGNNSTNVDLSIVVSGAVKLHF